MRKIAVVLFLNVYFIYPFSGFEINGINYTFEVSDYNLHMISYNEFSENKNYKNLIGRSIWNICEYSNNNFSILQYQHNWYRISSFILNNSDILINGISFFGKSVDEIIEIYGTPADDREINNGHRKINYGKKYHSINPHQYIFEITFFLNVYLHVNEIHINIIEIVVNENIENLLILNQWKNIPTHWEQSIFQFNYDKSLTYFYGMGDNKYELIDGTWEIIYKDHIPFVVIKFNKNIFLNEDVELIKDNNEYSFFFNISRYIINSE